MAAAVALALPGISYGLGLGRVVGEPILGESLLIEVPVTGTVDRPLDTECVSVRPSPESIDPEYFPRDMTARIERQGGATRVVVATRSAVRQPLVEFRLSVTCGYNFSSDYLLMASPRKEAAVQPVAIAGRAEAASASRAKPSAAAGAAVSASPASADGALPGGIAGKTIVLDKDMTLEKLARKHFPGPLRQGRFMRWVAEANPQLFGGAKPSRQHKLQAGQQIVIPDGVPPRRPGDYKDGRTPLGEPMGEPRTDAAAARAQGRPPAEEPAQVIAPRPGGSGRKDRLVVGSGGARDAKETVALVERLTGMMEQQLATQSANDEKIRQLEATIGELGQTIARLEKEAAEREARWKAERLAEKQAEQAVRDREEDRGWWHLLMAVAVGGILGAGVLQGLRAMTGRKQAAAEAGVQTANMVPAAATSIDTTGQGEPAARPLTEFGWDEESEPPAKPTTSAPAGARPGAEARIAPSVPASGAAVPGPRPAPANTGLEVRPTRPAQPAVISFEPPSSGSTPPALPAAAAAESPTDPAKAAIELANIMTSMGLADSAAQTLVEHINENPRQSLGQWLKLLEIYRLQGNRGDFEKYAQEMRLHFNVQPEDWKGTASQAKSRVSLEDFPHIRAQIVSLWRKRELVDVLQTLLLDNRGGTRAGFPMSVAEEILLLLAMIDELNT